ncbi:protein translocase subunit SecD [Eubacterium pyruvativorans]|uniref:protein translocase subunit SecD n=1 Tax=Eubacterium pyruvativorans TaxID=155865 RepID=UPI000880D3DA|nr:protein translocase subunit SecD [Eubacterium pyruvativorans]MCI5747096.1 protein translocase subunit SecD [Eubacterium pyruvativorans]MDD7685010.1 protein translocase subunit SecD [Eubacterium pyruvativorans]SDE55562.1 SecD/SecF fusion protein [Eubacterium pyruvativorans]
MKSQVRKVLSVVIIAVVILGWCASIFGMGPVKKIKDTLNYGLDINGGVFVVMQADTKGMSPSKTKTVMEQTREVINKRVNAMGISEATVSIEGTNRLRIEMPGVKDADTAIKRIGKTAKLKFTLADGTEVLSGSDVKNAAAAVDSQNGGYKITMKFTGAGQSKFAQATERAASGNVNATVEERGQKVDPTAIVIKLDDDILTAPTVREKIDNDSCEITRNGGFSEEEASQTAALIRGGALPVSLTEAQSSVESASIGANALDKSIVAGAIGLGLVFLLMLFMYNVLGLIADVALALYVLIVLWVMAGMGAVLTLPGIAGIVLGIGMAVDANVIIFSRIKEEIGQGRSIRVAVSTGFKHALTTVLDSQITTLIATIVLYQLGSTTVKGFAVTLMISILASIFTAVVISQIMVGTLAESKFARYRFFGCNNDGTPRNFVKKQFRFIQHRKIFYCASAAVILCGLVFLGVRGFNYGIDFTGGTSIEMNMGQKVSIPKVEKTISEFKLDPSIVYSGEGQKNVIIKTTKGLTTPQRKAVTDKLRSAYGLGEKSIISSQEFGATVGKEIRNNAIKSILIAAFFMLLYIIFRFKTWKYGVAAIAGIGHDVLVMIAFYAIFGVTVNNPFIAAILTIVGYSINDTIVIFDRVRENRHIMRNTPVGEVLDTSINQTLNRSIMTSLTTVVSIIPLLVMVSGTLAQFVLPLMVGVLCGTYSSIFLCSPLYYEFNRSAERSRYQQQQKAKERIEAKKAQKKAQKQLEEKAEEQNASKGAPVKNSAPKKKPRHKKSKKK